MHDRLHVNQRLNDNAIRHALLLEGYKAREVRAIIKLLDKDVFPDILKHTEKIGNRLATVTMTPARRARLEAMLAEMRDIVRAGTVVLHRGLRERLLPLARQEAAWAAGQLETVVPLDLPIGKASPELLRSIVTSRPMQGRFLREWSASVGAETTKRVQQQIRIGMAQGEPTDAIVRRLRGRKATGYTDGVLQTTRHEAAAIVRTAVSHISNQAKLATWEANKDLTPRYEWVSTLDGRTSQICAGLSGRVFKVGSGPLPPAHFNCRSSTAPVTPSLSSIGAKYGIKLGDLPPGTRASMNGQVAEDLTFGKWLRKQPVELQNQVLGVRKGQLFRRGKVPIERFVDVKSLRPRSYEELLEIERRIEAAGKLPAA